jgi:RNA polymerase sigma-70 factor, ECF subfamily
LKTNAALKLVGRQKEAPEGRSGWYGTDSDPMSARSIPPPADSSRISADEQAQTRERRARRDAELLERVRDEPVQGAGLLYARFSEDVNRLVWRLLGADADHHDIVQQVFLKILQHCDALREPEKLASWVQSITVNTVYEELRKREVRRIFLRESQPAEIHPSLVHDVEVRDFLMRAKSVLDKLPAKERIVFALHILEGQTLHEISATLGYSLATAKRRLSAAHRRFSSLIAHNPDLMRLFSQREAPAASGVQSMPVADESLDVEVEVES